jgi:hypothetical protein
MRLTPSGGAIPLGGLRCLRRKVQTMSEPRARKFMVLKWDELIPDDEFENGLSVAEIRAYCREILKANLAGGKLGITVYHRKSFGLRQDRLFCFGRVEAYDSESYDDKLAQRILKGL